MSDRVGEHLGNYRLLRLLGRGGFAAVYLGEHTYLKSLAALKVLHTHLNEEDTAQFMREAQLLAGLTHPHIVRVLDFAVQDGTPFLVMEYAPGGPLRQRHPKEASLPLETIVSYVSQVASALQYAHDQRLIHRDVKPENMLLNAREDVVLSDFGLAMLAPYTRSRSTQAMNQSIVGTAAYLAPEQVQGNPRPASDQYALGVVVYEWLCGKRPFTGTPIEIAMQHLSAPPPPLRQVRPDLPPAVEEVVLRALAKDPKDRFATVQEFAAALATAQQAQLLLSIPPLHISLLGEFLLVLGETPVTTVDWPRLQSLLTYLLLHRTAPQSRSSLAYLLWPDSTDAQAHTNLRQLVHRLRHSLPQADRFVRIEKQTLQWQPTMPWTLDVADFERALAQADEAEQAQDRTAARLALEQAVEIYRGDLLPGCYDEWILPERERLRQLFLAALERLLLLLEREGQYQAAISAAQRMLRHDPLYEATYRHLMHLYAANGDRAAALRTYHTCVTVLERELATEPAAATRAAYEQLLQKEAPPAALPATPPLISVTTAPPLGHQQEVSSQSERPWNVPFARNPFFTGRGPLLQRLHEQLSHTRRAALNQSYALSGLGGIGKTQIAIEYAYRYRNEYTAVLWARAASQETLVADFVALSHLLELPGQDAQDQMLIVAAVKRWLERQEGWLLILDNADELTLVTDFLPGQGKGHLLLTTRTQATGRIAKSLSVEKMELSEGVQLLLRRAKLLDPDEMLDNVSAAVRQAAQKLVEELDGLPLALDQAGAYVEETGCGLSEYLALYSQRRLALLKRQSSVSTDYPHTVASTWDLSFSQVEQADPAAAELLRLCAFLHPDAIPEAIITEGAAELGPVLSPVAADPLLLNEAIQLVRRYSLLKRDPEAKLLNIHRLVQVVLKEGLDEAAQRQWAERCVRAVNAAFPEVSFATWDRCERCLPHVQVCAEVIEEHHLSFPEAARLLQQAGIYLRDRGLLKQAELLLQQALRIREQVLGPEHPETANTLHHLGWLYREQGRYEQAELLYQRALAICEQALGSGHPDTANTLDHLGVLYWYQGQYEQAEPLYQRALAVKEQVLGPEHPDTANTLGNLAVLYHDQSKHEQAELLYQRALTISEQVLGLEHPDTANILNNLAHLYKDRGQYEQAEPLYHQALAIKEQVLGPTHPDTAGTLNNLAHLYSDREQYEQAEPLYRRVLAICEQVLGPEHPHTAVTLSNLAKLYINQGQYERAESLLERALTIAEHTLSPEHPRIATMFIHQAHIYEYQGRHEQAEPLYQRALAIREKALGPEHPDTVATQQDLARLLHTVQEQQGSTPQPKDLP